MKTRMNVCNQGEADFFLSHIQKHHRVLEFGSGGSTLDIAHLCGSLVSVEHNKEWYDKMLAQIPDNVSLLFHPPSSEPTGGDDGTAEQFHDYINAPLKFVEKDGPFDIIFIDGRARVACAEICEKYGHSGTLVFIHDYNHPNPEYLRTEYFDAEKYLTRLDGYFTMWMFLITAHLEANEAAVKDLETSENSSDAADSPTTAPDNDNITPPPPPPSDAVPEGKKKTYSKDSSATSKDVSDKKTEKKDKSTTTTTTKKTGKGK